MPTYEYKCNACGHRFEEFQSITAAPIKKCPSCGKKAVERLISAGGGLIFKGSGFYITDYRDQSYNDKAKAEAGGDKKEAAPAAAGDAKPAAASDAKTDAKPAAKSESKTESTAPKAETKPPKSEGKSSKSSAKKG